MIAAKALNHHARDSQARLLKDVDLHIQAGERIGIVGPSGSGKTTLALHLGGLHAIALEGRSTGSLSLGGEECIQAGRRGFAGFVLQNPENQFFCDRVEDEVAFGGGSPERIDGLLERTGLAAFREADPATLSLGWKQRLSIAGMLAREPSVLILDEPTNYLDAPSADELFACLEAGGARITLLVDHGEARLRRWATRLLRVEAGRLVEDGPPEAVAWPAPLPELPALPAPGEPLLLCEGLSFAHGQDAPLFTDFELTLRAGEIVALQGPNGSGKSTLLRLAKGLLRPTRGRIRVASGRPLMGEVGLVFQNPDEQLFALTVAEECAFLPRNQGHSQAEARRMARETLARMGLGPLAGRLPFSLSYGEKRRLTLASVLVGRPPVLCLDEPTAALDRPNLAILAELLHAHAAGGGAVLFATHDQAFARAVAGRTIQLGARP